jgi:hypothetical protein
MFALLVAHKAVEQYSGTPFHKPLQLAFQKLTGQLDGKERYSLQDYEGVVVSIVRAGGNRFGAVRGCDSSDSEAAGVALLLSQAW